MTAPDAVRHTADLCIPAGHPALPGHFPGRPVVPAVVLLEGVIEAAEHWLGRPVHARGLRQAKFVAPLLPGERAHVVLTLAVGSLDFCIERGQTILARGSFTFDGTAAA